MARKIFSYVTALAWLTRATYSFVLPSAALRHHLVEPKNHPSSSKEQAHWSASSTFSLSTRTIPYSVDMAKSCLRSTSTSLTSCAMQTQTEHNDHTTDAGSNYESMPWQTSIHPGHSLTFMPYFTLAESMLNSLTNVRRHHEGKYHYKEQTTESNPKQRMKRARIINDSYESDEYRKIRMTYYDAGQDTQVFNSLWYPRAELGDLPLLGIDLIQFKDRFLVVVDFQPLNEKQDLTEVKEVWDNMPDVLKGRMSNRFYDENRFFSNHMLFGRFKKEDAVGDDGNSLIDVGGDLWNAVQSYVGLHIDLVQKMSSQVKNQSPEVGQYLHVMEKHRDYDIYSAERDPAHAMFVKMFGQEYADGFVHDFLFALSNMPS